MNDNFLYEIPRLETLKVVSEIFCSKCQNLWMASGSHGLLGLKCPFCSEESGRVLVEHKPSDGEYGFQCNCGSKTFFIKKPKNLRASVYCRHCGIEAIGWF
ncbi:hypothetical protein [Pseudomonas sp. GL-B-16]|uniref:hypothetical protein n=1 Tax=Pseudomonas sp. GL-B-16 TaxID=2832373 RepID=UPI001CBC6993|nr:hypothetical protein [Pseudomonas sp. GL-B-16]